MRIKPTCCIQRNNNSSSSSNSANMASLKSKTESFVWSDCECEVLLRLTLDYKTTKLQQNIDWESCQSKYLDLANAFRDQYPKEPTFDFPHDAMAISKTQVASKLKSIRGKYRRAVDTGRRSGQGRVVLVFYELCQEIWGGSPATRCIDSAIETDDLLESCSERSVESPESLPPADVKKRQAKLDGHRGDRLKRKAQADPAVEEDLKIKRRMLELAEESTRIYSESLVQINNNIANICSTIQDGFSLIREMMCRPPQQQFVHPHSSNGRCHAYPPSSYMDTALHPTTQFFHDTPGPNQPVDTPAPTPNPGNEKTFLLKRKGDLTEHIAGQTEEKFLRTVGGRSPTEQLSPHIKEEQEDPSEPPHIKVDHEEPPEPPHIKEDQEEPFTTVLVKSEDDEEKASFRS